MIYLEAETQGEVIPDKYAELNKPEYGPEPDIDVHSVTIKGVDIMPTGDIVRDAHKLHMLYVSMLDEIENDILENE